MADIEFINNQIKDEIKVDSQGRGFSTIRGAARIISIDERALRRHFKSADKKPSKLAEMLIQQGFDMRTFAEDGIPDAALALIVKYYAWMAGEWCTDQAKLFDLSLTATSIRIWMQSVAGWHPTSNRKLSSEEIVSICVLPGGRDWEPRFRDSFYAELSRLTGLSQDGYKRPALWGKLTDEWVYQMLPVGVRNAVRSARIESDGWHKLHQFLSDDGLAVFEEHMKTLLTLMRAADSVNGVRRSLRNMTRSEYQYRLFEDCRKDGKLTLSRQLQLPQVVEG